MPFRNESIEAIGRMVKARSQEEYEAAKADFRRALGSSARYIHGMHYRPPDRGRWLTHPRLTPERLARYRNRSFDELAEDLICAFDKLESSRTKIWVLGGVVGAQTGIIAWLADQVMACIKGEHLLHAALRLVQ